MEWPVGMKTERCEGTRNRTTLDVLINRDLIHSKRWCSGNLQTERRPDRNAAGENLSRGMPNRSRAHAQGRAVRFHDCDNPVRSSLANLLRARYFRTSATRLVRNVVRRLFYLRAGSVCVG